MDVSSSPLTLGNDISVATQKLVKDQLEAQGQAAIKLIESAAPAQSAASSGGAGSVVNVRV